MELYDKKKNIHSQNGEDGIIESIFEKIGTGSKVCCEFGAWDGIYLSNTRNLIEGGWKAIMIEGDPIRFQDLVRTYEGNENVHCVNAFVDCGNNRLENILAETGMPSVQFLSIDIDGLDYAIFSYLKIRPALICVETSTVFDPRIAELVPDEIAKNNIGQSLGAFSRAGQRLGYSLVCYTGNAFYVRDDLAHGLRVLSDDEAYLQHINRDLSYENRKYLYAMNTGIHYPYFRHRNRILSGRYLGLKLCDIFKYRSSMVYTQARRILSQMLPFLRNKRRR